MRRTRLLFSVLSLLSVSGCIEAIHEGLLWTKDVGTQEAWKNLALQGDAEAQYKVGTIYCCGERPRYDTVQALFWWCQAARQNQRDALLDIGKLYENAHKQKGTIVPRNNTLAFVYYTKAVEHGNDDAVMEYKKLEPNLSPEERDDVVRLLKSWPSVPCEVYR